MFVKLQRTFALTAFTVCSKPIMAEESDGWPHPKWTTVGKPGEDVADSMAWPGPDVSPKTEKERRTGLRLWSADLSNVLPTKPREIPWVSGHLLLLMQERQQLLGDLGFVWLVGAYVICKKFWYSKVTWAWAGLWSMYGQCMVMDFTWVCSAPDLKAHSQLHAWECCKGGCLNTGG